jgi:predicted membrane channel-forming protein YqfA (hemolysin III family)
MGFLVKMLSGENENNPSSKRTITFIAFLLVAIGYIAEMFFGKNVNPQTFEMLMYIVLGGMGFTATEKFTNKNKNKDE